MTIKVIIIEMKVQENVQYATNIVVLNDRSKIYKYLSSIRSRDIKARRLSELLAQKPLEPLNFPSRGTDEKSICHNSSYTRPSLSKVMFN